MPNEYFLFCTLLYFCIQIEVIRGLAILKKSTAIVNKEFGLDAKIADVIVKAADEVCHRTVLNYSCC